MLDRTFLPKVLFGLLLGCSMCSHDAAAVTGFDIAKVRVKAGSQWFNVPQSSPLEWKLSKDMSSWPATVDVEVTWKSTYVTFTYAAEPLQTEVFLDNKLQGHATMGDWKGTPAWVYTFSNRPKSSSFYVELHDVLGSNDVWSLNVKITLKPIIKIYFPSILVNQPLKDQVFPAGTKTVTLVISPLIPKKPPAVIRLEAQRIVSGQWTWTAPGTSDFGWGDFPYALPTPYPASYRVRFSGDSGAYTSWVNFTVQ
jgi:hypothetical protein